MNDFFTKCKSSLEKKRHYALRNKDWDDHTFLTANNANQKRVEQYFLNTEWETLS